MWYLVYQIINNVMGCGFTIKVPDQRVHIVYFSGKGLYCLLSNTNTYFLIVVAVLL